MGFLLVTLKNRVMVGRAKALLYFLRAVEAVLVPATR
jgi:hypothetical protein